MWSLGSPLSFRHSTLLLHIKLPFSGHWLTYVILHHMSSLSGFLLLCSSPWPQNLPISFNFLIRLVSPSSDISPRSAPYPSNLCSSVIRSMHLPPPCPRSSSSHNPCPCFPTQPNCLLYLYPTSSFQTSLHKPQFSQLRNKARFQCGVKKMVGSYQTPRLYSLWISKPEDFVALRCLNLP